MVTTPIQKKTEGFGPLIYRITDKVTHFYQYYTIMRSMGDEQHDLHLVVDEDFHTDDIVLHESGIISKCLGFNLDAVKLESGQLWRKDCKKLIATTNQEAHKKYGVPLISEEIIRKYAYEDQYGGLKSVELEVENVYIEPERIHLNRGYYFKEVPKLNSEGEVTMVQEPTPIKNKKTEQELELIFDECAKKHMFEWSLDSFKKSHSMLFKSIIESLKNVENGRN